MANNHRSCHGCRRNPNPLLDVKYEDGIVLPWSCQHCYSSVLPDSRRRHWTKKPVEHTSCIGCALNSRPYNPTGGARTVLRQCNNCFYWDNPDDERTEWTPKYTAPAPDASATKTT